MEWKPGLKLNKDWNGSKRAEYYRLWKKNEPETWKKQRAEALKRQLKELE